MTRRCAIEIIIASPFAVVSLISDKAIGNIQQTKA
jgi:hypothetical protein